MSNTLWGYVPLPADEFLRGEFCPPVYMCRRAKGAPRIDGDMFKPFWDAAERTQPFRDIEGAMHPAPLKEHPYRGGELFSIFYHLSTFSVNAFIAEALNSNLLMKIIGGQIRNITVLLKTCALV